jgi:hypothetical protein
MTDSQRNTIATNLSILKNILVPWKRSGAKNSSKHGAEKRRPISFQYITQDGPTWRCAGELRAKGAPLLYLKRPSSRARSAATNEGSVPRQAPPEERPLLWQYLARTLYFCEPLLWQRPRGTGLSLLRFAQSFEMTGRFFIRGREGAPSARPLSLPLSPPVIPTPSPRGGGTCSAPSTVKKQKPAEARASSQALPEKRSL